MFGSIVGPPIYGNTHMEPKQVPLIHHHPLSRTSLQVSDQLSGVHVVVWFLSGRFRNMFSNYDTNHIPYYTVIYRNITYRTLL